jgi:hypothetical protein
VVITEANTNVSMIFFILFQFLFNAKIHHNIK